MTVNINVDFFKRHLPAVIALAGAAWARYGTSVEIYVKLHPKLSAYYGVAAFLVGFYMKSPLFKNATQNLFAGAIKPEPR